MLAKSIKGKKKRPQFITELEREKPGQKLQRVTVANAQFQKKMRKIIKEPPANQKVSQETFCSRAPKLPSPV